MAISFNGSGCTPHGKDNGPRGWDFPNSIARMLGRSILAGKELFQGSANLRHIHGGDFPEDLQIDVDIVVGDDVAHAAHFAKGEFWDGLAACRRLREPRPHR